MHLAFDPGSLVEPLQAIGLKTLQHWQQAHAHEAPPDLAFVIAGGLSPRAAMHQALPLMTHVMQRLQNETQQRWTLTPVALVEQGRVAIGDESGALPPP